MDLDLVIPIFWTVVFGTLITIGVRRIAKKLPVNEDNQEANSRNPIDK